jgi:AraC-like DNA-binding protein
VPAGGFEYREMRPPAGLAAIVDRFWVTSPAPGEHRVVPDGCMDILVSLGDRPRAVVVGAMTRPVTARVDEPIVAVRFLPGRGAAPLGVDASVLRDGEVDLADLWGARGRELCDRVGGARTVAERLGALERIVAREAARSPESDARIRRAVDLVRARGGDVSVTALARAACLGERQLERAFDRWVGVGPKLFCRIVRLEAARAAIRAGARGWADIAITHGFSDQAHMVREARALLGVTPSELAREAPPVEMSDSFKTARAGGGMLGA